MREGPSYEGAVSMSGFVAVSLRELGIGLCKGSYLLHPAALGVLAEASDQEWVSPLRLSVTSGASCGLMDSLVGLCFLCVLAVCSC
jgi:hypothetical protein